ncbi:cell division protein FtsA [Streptococcus zalophi]|uniref:Cell division protein FtsA n=1 Tax=Streptococcus zalophi TaxID=640031 RepID=A0A934UDD2_9STRE|nr:cell division protein FtsA [Streptococcus zalophi]MBJ8349682.1 cell division protein FtsA [Streptococcus zalophi]MCR8967969.1 cell division protein FtsA [Streptococcus zalophi]
MARNGFFTGLDIGTSSIKVLVAEFVDNEMNVIGVSNVKSSGVRDGIIIDIDAASKAIRTAVDQAEEKAGISIDKVNVSLPANLLQIEPTQGMIPVTSDSKEIKDEDVDSVVKSALTKSITPEREVISLVPDEFIVDGFKGIRDPRGMMGIRLEMRGLLYTGPSTILHNLRKTVEKAGIAVDNVIISPLAMTKYVLNEGEREFGATVIDMGGGQTSVASMRSQVLQFTNIYPEGGDYVTKDISKVLKTSINTAEAIKYNFGNANVSESSTTETIQVEVVGETQPIDVSERYISEIISARVRSIFDHIKQDLERNRSIEFPGGIILAGGGAIIPGVVELAQETFGVNVKLFVPNQMGIRNPMFANVISLVDYVGSMSDVDIIAQRAVTGEELLRRRPIDTGRVPVMSEPVSYSNSNSKVDAKRPHENDEPKPKENIGDKVRNIFGSMFD